MLVYFPIGCTIFTATAGLFARRAFSISGMIYPALRARLFAVKKNQKHA
jgi:hypothetical protein